MRRRVATFLTLVSLAAVLALPSSAARAEVPLGCASKVEIPSGDFTQPPNLDLIVARLKNELLYYRCTSYDADIAKVLNEAIAWVKARAPEVVAAGKAPAIVLDIDETSLSNWPVINADDFGFIAVGPCDLSSSGVPIGACGWIKWIMQARDKPIIPTLELYRQARRQGVAVFFITGRPESLRAATERNLRAAGYSDWNALVMEPGNLPRLKSAADFKAPARKKIEEQGYTIVLDMGDQQSDLLGGYAERTFKLPDPFYYVP